jgi:hypothetical protein
MYTFDMLIQLISIMQKDSGLFSENPLHIGASRRLLL